MNTPAAPIPLYWADDIRVLTTHPDDKDYVLQVAECSTPQRAKEIAALLCSPPAAAQQTIPEGFVLVPVAVKDAVDNLLKVKGRHHTFLAYKQLEQAVAAAPEAK